jgi:predicted DNA-binding transcriptional regulator YafY
MSLKAVSKMPRPGKSISKTERILEIYHLFKTCWEVSAQEIIDSVGSGWSTKTFSRDISLLKSAGVPIHYSGKQKAYVLAYKKGEGVPPDKPNNKPEPAGGKKAEQYIEKLRRLTTLMDFLRGMTDEPCDVWYRETFPEISERTMQRDFALLRSIGYIIEYKRAWDEPWDKENELPLGFYYFMEPYPYGF